MITLNLIPENEKKELQLLNTYVAIKNLVLVILLGVMVSSIMLLIGKIILLQHFTETVSENVLKTFSINITNIDIKKLKKEMDAAKEIQKNHINWINFFIHFNTMANNGIAVNSLEINGQGGVNISGLAKERQNLIDFEKNINDSGYFNEFKFPYDSLFKKNDIIFNISLIFDVNAITRE